MKIDLQKEAAAAERTVPVGGLELRRKASVTERLTRKRYGIMHPLPSSAARCANTICGRTTCPTIQGTRIHQADRVEHTGLTLRDGLPRSEMPLRLRLLQLLHMRMAGP